MKLAFYSRVFLRYPLKKAFEVAYEYGYDGVEIWAGRPHAFPKDLDAKKIDEINSMKQKYHLEVPMIAPEVCGYPFSLASQDKKERMDTIQYFKECIDLSTKIGCPRVQVAVVHTGYNTSRSQNMANLMECMIPITEYAEKNSVDLVIEPLSIMEGNIMILLDDVVEFMDKMNNNPRIKVMIDTVTPTLHYETMSDYFEKLGKKMDYVHFVGCDGVGHHHYVPGEGRLPLEECIRIFRQYGYDGWLSVELNEPEYRDPELFIGQSMTNLKKMFAL